MADVSELRDVREITGVCAKFYPKCCSYHEGWDDAMHYVTEFYNVEAK